jgi:hypothetical protein
MNTLPKLASLPLELCSKNLAGYAQPGEPMICLQIPSVGNFTPFRLRGRTNRTYRFEWDRNVLAHALRVPASIWMMEGNALAKDVFHQVLLRPVVPVLEMTTLQAETQKPGASGQMPESNNVKAKISRPKAAPRKKAAA